MNIKEIKNLLIDLKQNICDDYRCSDDPDDGVPGMVVTIATKDGNEWGYQTGDNSYSGACYFYPKWSVIYLYRDSNCLELARDTVNELRDMIASD